MKSVTVSVARLRRPMFGCMTTRYRRFGEIAAEHGVVYIIEGLGGVCTYGKGHCANDLLYDSVFYSVYSNIPLKYTHLRIEPYTRVRILKYNRSRDIHGRLASL